MEAGRQRALVRASIVGRKQKEKEGASTSAPKVITKGTSKNERKDDRPHKKGSGTPVGDKQLKQPSSPKPSHGTGKGLMTTTSPITQGTIHRLFTHKEHIVEMVESIIKETNLDPCAEQMTQDLGASGLFDLSRVRFFLRFFSILLFIHLLTVVLISSIGAHEGVLR